MCIDIARKPWQAIYLCAPRHHRRGTTYGHALLVLLNTDPEINFDELSVSRSGWLSLRRLCCLVLLGILGQSYSTCVMRYNYASIQRLTCQLQPTCRLQAWEGEQCPLRDVLAIIVLTVLTNLLTDWRFSRTEHISKLWVWTDFFSKIFDPFVS